ncbi:autotransporter outer membrane beta-barrel domain-containing protein [Parasphingopyxis algicola]|uniref:autotransporter domain-containing protein n=1 Tax=Parasphingopyxis algicola TaxID=2026624 RepID=UPI0015A00061|nr:autotransporter domain-containing protein [Parasphingopyxis algicola]QLC23956.1 autotransporter outer membrane beta-barrel domain-containing protein [Parasphingopyxis algicola]
MRITPRCAVLALTLAITPHSVYAQGDDASDQRNWSIMVSGGITAFGEDQEQPFVSAALRREFGDFHLSLGGVLVGYDGPPPIIGDTIPATTRQLVLGAGYGTSAFALDAYISIGDRDFDRIMLTAPNGTILNFNADGSSRATGASATYQIALGGRWYLSPFVALDYSEIDTLQAIAGPTGDLVARRISESGVTGSGGATLQYALGMQSQHSLGLYTGLVSTSNAASTTRIGRTGAVTSATQRIDGAGDGDTWLEYGVSTNFTLSQAVVLDLAVSRTTGLKFGEATSASAGVSVAF